MGTNKKNARATQAHTVRNRIFTEFDLQKERNIDQNLQTQGKKTPTVIPETSPFD